MAVVFKNGSIHTKRTSALNGSKREGCTPLWGITVQYSFCSVLLPLLTSFITYVTELINSRGTTLHSQIILFTKMAL
jgi:hypothetical protein